MKKEIKYKVGDRFKTLTLNSSLINNYKKGDVVILTDDDGSRCPFFLNTRTREIICIDFKHLKPLKSPKKVKRVKPQKEIGQDIYGYWTIEKVDNGYLLKNSYVTAVFPIKKKLLKYLEARTK